MQVCFLLLCLFLCGDYGINLRDAPSATVSLPRNPRKSERHETRFETSKQRNSGTGPNERPRVLGTKCSHLILPAPLNDEQR